MTTYWVKKFPPSKHVPVKAMGFLPPGPWDDEEDLYVWRQLDYYCVIRRHMHTYHLNGYVGVPEGHLAYGKHYDETELLTLSVHGGLTFADGIEFHAENVNWFHPSTWKMTKVWLFGFDCGHMGDLQPLLEATVKAAGGPDKTHWGLPPDTYRDAEYVKSQVNSLAEQLYVLDFASKMGLEHDPKD